MTLVIDIMSSPRWGFCITFSSHIIAFNGFCYCCSVTQLCLTLWLHGLYTIRLLCPWDFLGKSTEWVAISFFRGSSPPRILTHVSCIVRQIFFFFFFTTEPPGPSLKLYFYLICVFICLIFAYYKPHDSSDHGFFVHSFLPWVCHGACINFSS